MAVSLPLRWFLNLKNTLDYALRQHLAWSRPGLSFANQSKKGLFQGLPEGQRRASQARAADLVKQYHLAAFRDASSVDNYLENLYYLDLLEKALEAGGSDLPRKIDAADIGCSSWFYVQALHAALTWWRCPDQRAVTLSGFEADPYRAYSNFHSRCDHARAHMRRLEKVDYVPRVFQRQPGRFDLITMLFPFVFIDDHLGWGLPAGMFDPAALLGDACASLNPEGLLLIVNQGEAEHHRQREMLDQQGMKILAARRHDQPLFYSYEIDRYILVSKHDS